MQRKRAHDLLQVAARYPSFPIVLEAYRECLRDVFDLPGLVEIASRVRRREIRLVTVDTQSPSPFSASLLFGYVANYLYEGDAPLAERRAQALAVDQAQLRELLGEAELRELIDRRALGELEIALQCLDAAHQATSPERLHDLLLRLGDLSPEEAAARVRPLPEGDAAAAADAWLDALERERRAIRIHVAGEERWAAAEDAGRLRDALGIAPPPGLPAAFLEPQPHALREVVSRYARTHGPFAAADVARRYATGEAPVLAALAELLKDGRVLEGEFRPGGHGREWCGPDVLATLRRRSLAALRKQVEPAEPSGPRAAARGLAGRRHRPRHAPRPRRAPRRDRAAAGRRPPRLDPRARRAARAHPGLPARGPRHAVRGGRGGLGRPRPAGRSRRPPRPLPGGRPAASPAAAPRPAAGPRPPAAREGDLHDRIREHLARHGASLLRRDPRGRRGGAGAAGAGRAVGPGLGGRGHERHAGGAAGLSRGARGARGAKAPRVELPLAPAGPALGRGPLEPPAGRRAGPRAPPRG